MAQTTYTNTLPLESMLMEYQLVSVLGVGGFGITYLARDTHLEKVETLAIFQKQMSLYQRRRNP